MERILIGYPLDKYKELTDILAPLKAKFNVVFRDYNIKWLRQNIHSFHILIPSINVSIDEKIIRKAKLLRFIFTPTTGIDHLKFDIRKTKIKVWSLADFPKDIENISSTAELAFSFILSLSHRVFLAERDVLRKGKWQRNNFIGNEIRGKTLGILGLGRVGSRIAKYGETFGMHIIYYDINKKTASKWKRKKNVESLFKESDYLVCAIPLNPETVHFINQQNVRFLKKGAFFINISRGRIIDERVICWALDKSILSGVATDVLEEELVDFKSSFLYRYAKKHPEKNILVTPHIGGATTQAWREVFSLAVNKILQYK